MYDLCFKKVFLLLGEITYFKKTLPNVGGLVFCLFVCFFQDYLVGIFATNC